MRLTEYPVEFVIIRGIPGGRRLGVRALAGASGFKSANVRFDKSSHRLTVPLAFTLAKLVYADCTLLNRPNACRAAFAVGAVTFAAGLACFAA